MNTKLFLLLACISLTSSGTAKERISDLHPEETVGFHGDNKGHLPGQSVGSGLVSIAQGAVDQAQRAIASQATAGAQAAFQAQAGLAQTAVAAATTAQAALAGKQAIVSVLEQQLREAQSQVKSESLQLIQAHRSATAAQEAAQQAQQIQDALSSALSSAELGAQQAQQAAREAATEFAYQGNMLGTAKQRLALVEEQLGDARADLEATEVAAFKAQAAAQAAQDNASKQTVGVQGDHLDSGHHY
ncbi:uncharacterized protein YhiI [Anabrus simplex]|uniref:uncharacterized protein YhiI n=1 Tax=Anabrus simplex TaxID=316456 RepID=UPI0034DD7B7A